MKEPTTPAFYEKEHDAFIVATYNQLYTSSDNVNALLARVLGVLETLE